MPESRKYYVRTRLKSSRSGRTQNDMSQNVMDIQGRVRDVRRSFALAGVEAIAGIADAARQFIRGVADNEPFSTSETWASAIRTAPETLTAAADNAFDTAVRIPQRVVDTFYEEFDAVQAGSAKTGARSESVNTRRDYQSQRRERQRSTVVTQETTVSQPFVNAPGAEQRIASIVERYLNNVPSGGALLNSVVDNVVLETDYDRDIVLSVIMRNFVISGPVVTNRRQVVLAEVEQLVEEDPVVEWMREVLTERGYTGIRSDYVLTRFPDTDESAALVAFEGDDPQVLCYPVNEGDVDNPWLQEAAKFQAGAIAPGKAAHCVWVSDGISSYVFDMVRDRVLASLPSREELQRTEARASAQSNASSPTTGGTTTVGRTRSEKTRAIEPGPTVGEAQ